jgi:O-antigen/teichoic acid export membrane protein
LSIARRSAYAFGAQGLAFVLVLVNSIIISRKLGPQGRGIVALFAVALQTALALATLGISFSFAYFTGKKRFPVARLIGTALLLPLTLWAAVAALAVPAMPWLLRTLLRGLEPWHYILGVAVLPFVFVNLMLHNVLLGEGRVESLSRISAARSVLTTVAFVTVLVVFGLGVGAAVVTTAAMAVAQTLMLCGAAIPRHGISFRQFREIAAAVIGYGSKVYIGNLSSHFWLRVDVYLLNVFAGPTAVGHYTLATNLAEKVWMLEGSVMQAVLPDVISRNRADAVRLVSRTARMLLLFSAGLATSLAVVAPWVVPFLYGEAFRPAVLPLLLLLPGVTAITVARVFGGYYSGQAGRPLLVSTIAVVTAATSFVLYWFLIPHYGAAGAAIGSTGAYVLLLLIYLVKMPRDTGVAVRDLIVVRRADLAHLWALVVRAGSRFLPRSRTRDSAPPDEDR